MTLLRPNEELDEIDFTPEWSRRARGLPTWAGNGGRIGVAPRLFLKKLVADVLDRHLKGRAWVMGDAYTIADIAIFPWVNNLVGFYGAADLVGYADFANVQRTVATFLARPAVQRGLNIPQRPAA